MVLIVGPSSPGKITSCKRLSIRLLTNGIRPVQIPLDDHFVDRGKTPKDTDGDWDYESIHALDINLISLRLSALLRGEEVELPEYDFLPGRSGMNGKRLHLADHQVLLVEGTHVLNPELTAQIPKKQRFYVHVLALTSVLLDDCNYIPTTDNRLLGRIIRSHKYCGVSAQETIRR